MNAARSCTNSRAFRGRRSGEHGNIPPRPRPPLQALIAYSDLAAARRAMSALHKMLRESGREVALEPMLWRFDQLDDARRREMATIDALRAGMVVIATAESSDWPHSIDAWLSEVVARKPGVSTTLLAVLGDDDAWSLTLEGSAKTAQPAAQIMPFPIPAREASPAERSLTACAV